MFIQVIDRVAEESALANEVSRLFWAFGISPLPYVAGVERLSDACFGCEVLAVNDGMNDERPTVCGVKDCGNRLR